MTTKSISRVDDFMQYVKKRNPNEPEFIQAVHEVMKSIIPFVEKNKKYKEARILERIIEPDRIFIFRVPWIDDKGNYRINRGYRVQMNNAIGPYKGGLRFHPSVNLSIIKFLAFEQIFKNSLTTLPLGAGKGGSDFDPKGKSDNEVMSFCQSFMTELQKYIGPNKDIPAGDIGVGPREIGYLFGQYKRLNMEFTGVITGKAIEYGGSLIRREATGYGTVYFAETMLRFHKEDIKGKKAVVSGSGNVAQYVVEKLIELGAIPLTMSDSNGFIYSKKGITREQLEFIIKLKNIKRGRIKEAAKKFNLEYYEGEKPWGVKCDIAFPCATQNEINREDAETLLKNNCFAVCEGANMPSTTEAINVFISNKIMYAPGKAANAGGVAVSAFEMSQNAQRIYWEREQVDYQLKKIMQKIHDTCVKYGKNEYGDYVDYVKGANIGGFVKVADAMLAQGHV